MRKAKIAAMIFGGVSTCICGGILGVYSNASTVGTVAPKNDVENIYDVQSEKLANFAAVTSIETTAVTTTSTTPTTSFVISDSTTSTDETISVIYSTMPTTVATTTTVETTETTTTNNDVIDIADNDNDVIYDSTPIGGLTIDGPFIASDNEPETTTTTTEATTTAPVETTTTETTDEFVFEPADEYFPPAVEYIAPVQETTTTETTTEIATTVSETTTTETVMTETEETTTVTPAYIITTAEYTVSTTDVTTSSEMASATTAVQEDKTQATTTEKSLPITDEEYIVLCNAVANEAGSNWIDLYEKGKVVEVIMNRVNSPLYPDTILGVITQPYQFTGSENYAYLGTYSGYVTDAVKEAVELYFNEPSSFAHNYFGFWGDGYANHFY